MSSPDLTNAECEAVAAVLKTPNLSMGDEILAFETAMRKYSGAKHAIGVSSGTAGLHLCVRAAGIGPGDLVITTPFSFVASTNVLLFENAVPIFVDVDPVTGNIDPEMVKQAATDLTGNGDTLERWMPRKGADEVNPLKAILPVDVFGQPAAMEVINVTAQRYGLKVIEDSCEALGARYKGQPAGTLGDYGVYAFYPNKQITTGEGAMIVTNDDKAESIMRALRNQGRSPGDTWLQHTHLGYNYRLDEMSAALGRVQMERLDILLDKRAQVADWYNNRINKIPGVKPLEIVQTTTRMSWFVYVIRMDAEISRDDVAKSLKSQGIPARPYFVPIHLQPYMVERFGFREGDYPITESLGKCSLALPFSGVMSEEQVSRVCAGLEVSINDSQK